MSDRFPDQFFQALDANGNPISGAKLNFYRTGTSTPKDTYSDSAKTSANTNPVVADSAGRFGDIFMLTDEAYKVVYTDAADVVIATFDPFYPNLPPGNFPVLTVSSKSANYTVLTTDRGAVILVDASSGAVTITLLAAATAASGFSLTVIKTDNSSNVVTLDGDAAETIDGQTTFPLGSQHDAIEIIGNATAWFGRAKRYAPDMAQIWALS